MRLIKLLVVGGGAAVIYKRFFGGSREGHQETEQAAPFSSDEQLPDERPAAEPTEEAGQAQDAREGASEQNGDPLTQPSWLKPADG